MKENIQIKFVNVKELAKRLANAKDEPSRIIIIVKWLTELLNEN